MFVCLWLWFVCLLCVFVSPHPLILLNKQCIYFTNIFIQYVSYIAQYSLTNCMLHRYFFLMVFVVNMQLSEFEASTGAGLLNFWLGFNDRDWWLWLSDILLGCLSVIQPTLHFFLSFPGCVRQRTQQIRSGTCERASGSSCWRRFLRWSRGDHFVCTEDFGQTSNF